jgi:hypothetical protein
MKIDVRSDKSVYVDIGDWTYYIDDSTNEQIIKKWDNSKVMSDIDDLADLEVSG